jgi:hypothetical protein
LESVTVRCKDTSGDQLVAKLRRITGDANDEQGLFGGSRSWSRRRERRRFVDGLDSTPDSTLER